MNLIMTKWFLHTQKIILCCFLISCSQVVNALSTLSADDIVYDTTQEVLKRLEAEKKQLAADPNYIKVIVRELIVPHMDFHTMSMLVTGKYWSQYDDELQNCISHGFKNLLVERYAYILLSYRNQTISYQSAMPIGEKGYVSILQTLTRPEVKPLTIEYPMRPDGESWKVVDLVIDGVSLIKSYRKIFGKKIRHQGIYGFAASFPECN